MKITTIKHIQADLRRYVRSFVPPGPGAEMVCSALKADIDVSNTVAFDERGVAGAISYTVYPDRVHVFSLGSLVKGAGSKLMGTVERLAKRRRLPVTLNATQDSSGFYTRRGYVRQPSKAKSVIPMRRELV